MWRNSSELLDYAFRELQVAMEDDKQEVEIVLHEDFEDDLNKIKKLCDSLNIKTITNELREKFDNYAIRSEVFTKKNWEYILTYTLGNCSFCVRYPLVWKLTVAKRG